MVEAGEEFEPVLRVNSTKTGEEETAGIVLVVSDNGDGVPKEIREKIFEHFFTTKATGEGTGLGLSLCQDIVEKHGGTLRVDDDPSLGGARFEMWLPAAPPSQDERISN